MNRRAEEKREDRNIRIIDDMDSFYSKEECEVREAEAREYLASFAQKLK